MNTKQATAIRIIADWANRYECVTKAVIYGSVARGEESAASDLDVDLEYVLDLAAPGMAKSYTEAQASFEELGDELARGIGHRLHLSNYAKHHADVAAGRCLCGQPGCFGKFTKLSGNFPETFRRPK